MVIGSMGCNLLIWDVLRNLGVAPNRSLIWRGFRYPQLRSSLPSKHQLYMWYIGVMSTHWSDHFQRMFFAVISWHPNWRCPPPTWRCHTPRPGWPRPRGPSLRSGWWLVPQPIWNMLVKLDHFPKVRGENKQFLSCHHLAATYNCIYGGGITPAIYLFIRSSIGGYNSYYFPGFAISAMMRKEKVPKIFAPKWWCNGDESHTTIHFKKKTRKKHAQKQFSSDKEPLLCIILVV